MLLDLRRSVVPQVVDELASPLDKTRADLVGSLFRERCEQNVFGKKPINEDVTKSSEDKHRRLAAPGAGYDLERDSSRMQNACFLLRIRCGLPRRLRPERRDGGTDSRYEIC